MKVLVTGDAIVDHYVYGQINRQSPENESVPVIDIGKEEYRLGGCLNVAANIRSLGYPPEKGDPSISVTVDTIFSPFTGKMLYNKGILADDANIIDCNIAGTMLPSPREIIKTRIIDLATKNQVMRIDNRKKYSDRDLESYNLTTGCFDGYDAIVVSDYCKGAVNDEFLEKLKSYQGLVFVDTKKPDLTIWKRRNCIVKLNDKEYAKSSGEMCLETLIVTEGEKGSTLYHTPFPVRGRQTTHFEATPVKNPEVTGAGDVFISALVVKYLQTKDLHKSIEFANMAARFSVTQRGTTEVKISEGKFCAKRYGLE